MIDWIQGDKFSSLVSEKVFFSRTEDVNIFFENCQKDIPFILISHNGDGSITTNPRCSNSLETHHHADARLMPQNLYKWFGCMVEAKDPRIISIPLGVENQSFFENKSRIISSIKNEYIEKKEDKLVYVNFKISNNYSERISCYNSVKQSDFCTFTNQMFTEEQINPPTELFPNVYQESYEIFTKEIKRHKFVLCPVGNGLDSHRIWETLYLDSIPITRRNVNYSFYEDKLPILMIDEWEEITKEFLEEKYLEITNKKNKNYYNKDMLSFSYWQDLIKIESKKFSNNESIS